MPICSPLKSVSKRQHSSLAKAWSGDLQTDWQSGAGETRDERTTHPLPQVVLTRAHLAADTRQST
jgi:hypothetical protein